MKALQVLVNDEEKCVAGIGEFGNMYAVINYISPHPEDLNSQPPPPENMPAEMLSLMVAGGGGSMSGPQIHDKGWIWQTLQVGDRVEFKIVEVEEASAPIFDEKREVVSPQNEGKAYRHALYEKLKQEFEHED